MTFPIILAWIPSTFASDTKSGVGIGIVIAATHGVGIAGSYLYPSKYSPQFFMGGMVSCSLCFVACFCAPLMAYSGYTFATIGPEIFGMEDRRQARVLWHTVMRILTFDTRFVRIPPPACSTGIVPCLSRWSRADTSA